MDRRENQGNFSPSKPCATSPAVVILPLWLLEDPGFVKTKAYYNLGETFKVKEYKIRSRALEGPKRASTPEA